MNERVLLVIQILLYQGEMNGHTKMVDNTKEEKFGWEGALHISTPMFVGPIGYRPIPGILLLLLLLLFLLLLGR